MGDGFFNPANGCVRCFWASEPLGQWRRLPGWRELLLDFGKIGALNIEASNQLYSPNLLQHRHYLTQQPLWENNFKQTLETNVRVNYLLSNIGLEVGCGYYLFNQFIYFDTLGIARQTGLPLVCCNL